MKFMQILFNEQVSDDEEEDEEVEEGKWDMNSPDCDYVCVKANALADFLGIDKESIEEDKYEHYKMTQFKVETSGRDATYAVGNYEETQESAEQSVENLLDDVGYEGFREGFVWQFVDEDRVLSAIREDAEWRVYDNPESYLSDSDRVISDEQKQKIAYYKERIEFYRKNIEKFETLRDEIEDEDEISNIESRIEDLTEVIEGYDEEIVDIEENPEGEFTETAKEEYVEDMVNDAERNLEYHMREYGFEISDYVDRDKFIQGVIDEDGFGVISSYDGDYDETKFNGETFYIIRVD